MRWQTGFIWIIISICWGLLLLAMHRRKSLIIIVKRLHITSICCRFMIICWYWNLEISFRHGYWKWNTFWEYLWWKSDKRLNCLLVFDCCIFSVSIGSLILLSNVLIISEKNVWKCPSRFLDINWCLRNFGTWTKYNIMKHKMKFAILLFVIFCKKSWIFKLIKLSLSSVSW